MNIKEIKDILHSQYSRIGIIINETNDWLIGLFKFGIWLLRAKNLFQLATNSTICELRLI